MPAHIHRVARILFESEGYERVTMEQVASQAKVSKRTLYKYFPVKEALLESVLEAQLAEDLAQRTPYMEQASFRTGVGVLLQASAHWCERHADYLLPYIRHKFRSFDPTAVSRKDNDLVPVWASLIDAAQARGELRSNVSSAQLSVYFHYLYLGALMRWLTRPQLDLEEEFNTVVDLFVEGAKGQAA